MNENFTSTENDEKLDAELFTSNDKFLKIDYYRPAESTNDILSYIIKTNKMKVKTIDPLLNDQRFLIHSQHNFSNIKNKFFQDSKNSFIKKGFMNCDLNLEKKDATLILKRNENNGIVVGSDNEKVNYCIKNFNFTNTNLKEGFNYINGYEDNPIPSILKARSISYLTKFSKKNKL